MTYFPLRQTTCFFIPLVAPCKPLLTFEDYKSNHNVLIFSDLKGLETNVDKNIENAYDLLCALRDQGYYFCLTIDIDKASKTIIYDQDNEMISKDSFIQKFS